MKILALRMVPSHEFAAALRELKRAQPEAQITAVLMTPHGRADAAAVLGPERVEVAEPADRWELWRSLRRRRFDQVLLFARTQARPSPRAWPAYVVALSVPAHQRRLVTGGRTRRIGWLYLLSEFALFPVMAVGALVLWAAALKLVGVILAADLLRGGYGRRGGR